MDLVLLQLSALVLFTQLSIALADLVCIGSQTNVTRTRAFGGADAARQTAAFDHEGAHEAHGRIREIRLYGSPRYGLSGFAFTYEDGFLAHEGARGCLFEKWAYTGDLPAELIVDNPPISLPLDLDHGESIQRIDGTYCGRGVSRLVVVSTAGQKVSLGPAGCEFTAARTEFTLTPCDGCELLYAFGTVGTGADAWTFISDIGFAFGPAAETPARPAMTRGSMLGWYPGQCFNFGLGCWRDVEWFDDHDKVPLNSRIKSIQVHTRCGFWTGYTPQALTIEYDSGERLTHGNTADACASEPFWLDGDEVIQKVWVWDLTKSQDFTCSPYFISSVQFQTNKGKWSPLYGTQQSDVYYDGEMLAGSEHGVHSFSGLVGPYYLMGLGAAYKGAAYKDAAYKAADGGAVVVDGAAMRRPIASEQKYTLAGAWRRLLRLLRKRGWR